MLVALASGCSQGERKVTLRFRLAAGDVYEYHQDTKTSWQVIANDSVKDEGTHNYWVDITQRVTEAPAGEAAELLQIADFFIPQKQFCETDSAKWDTVSYTGVITLNMEANGRLKEVQFEPGRDDRHVTWMKSYYEQGQPVFPSGELPAGYEWTQTTTVLLPEQTMDASTTYRVKSFVREGDYDCALVEYAGTMVIPVIPSVKDTLGVTGHDNISTSGIIYFAYKEGLIFYERDHWEVKGYREYVGKDGELKTFMENRTSDTDYRMTEITRR